MSQLPLTIHYVKPRPLVIASVPPTSNVDETQQTICQQATVAKLTGWHEVIDTPAIIIGRETSTGAMSTGIHAIVPMVADSVPWIPNAIYSAWQWTPPDMREQVYETTMKIVQSWESQREEVENLEAVLRHGEEEFEEVKRKNDKSLDTARQGLELLKLAIGYA